MDADGIEDILRVIQAYARRRGMSQPERFRVDFSDPRDLIDLGFRTASLPPSEPGPQQQQAQQTQQPPPARPPVGEDAEWAPANVKEAIELYLRDVLKCQSGPEIAAGVQDLFPNRWEASYIRSACASMNIKGKLILREMDVGDGKGIGYGLPAWRVAGESTGNLEAEE